MIFEDESENIEQFFLNGTKNYDLEDVSRLLIQDSDISDSITEILLTLSEHRFYIVSPLVEYISSRNNITNYMIRLNKWLNTKPPNPIDYSNSAVKWLNTEKKLKTLKQVSIGFGGIFVGSLALLFTPGIFTGMPFLASTGIYLHTKKRIQEKLKNEKECQKFIYDYSEYIAQGEILFKNGLIHLDTYLNEYLTSSEKIKWYIDANKYERIYSNLLNDEIKIMKYFDQHYKNQIKNIKESINFEISPKSPGIKDMVKKHKEVAIKEIIDTELKFRKNKERYLTGITNISTNDNQNPHSPYGTISWKID